MSTEEDFHKFTLKQLKELLKSLGETTAGTKKQIVNKVMELDKEEQRLKEKLEKMAAGANDIDGSGEIYDESVDEDDGKEMMIEGNETETQTKRKESNEET